MKKSMITQGIYWVEIPEHDLRILCGCPADTIKHLMRCGFVSRVDRDGVVFETGPNAILLSDVSIQNGDFANLAEFPVLQMFYRQGMIIPGHPNNTGNKPLIIGAADQVQAQREYIFRGNYGLVSEDELIATGLDKDTAAEYMRIKRVFAFGSIRRPEELVDFHEIGDDPITIAPGVSIERVAINTYRISSDGDYVEVSLSLGRNEHYTPPYTLSQHEIKREYFSVVHTGEGDGWDPSRPCMASIITFQGRLYLIDAGPSVMHTLTALGLSVNQISGIFHTHAHDDHFAGLTSLVRTDHRLSYFATPVVRASVTKKLSALMSFPEEQFLDFFEPHDLVEGEWNNIDGLEVRPVYSPHPVDTTIMFFRTLWDDGYRTYAHFADIASMAQLATLMKDASPRGVELSEEIRNNYFTPVDIKKIDVGGGMIHGDAEDFRADQSRRIVLSHRATPLTAREKEIGADTAFGMQDVLIKASEAANIPRVERHLRHNFPEAPAHELTMLANCPTRTYSIGSILYRKESVPEQVYLLLEGLVEVINADAGIANLLTTGSMIGEINSLDGTPAQHTYRAASFIQVLEIPPPMYRRFIERRDPEYTILEYLQHKQFLMGTFLLGDQIAGATLNRIAREVTLGFIRSGETVFVEHAVLIVVEGELAIRYGGKRIAVVGSGDALGASYHMSELIEDMQYVATKDTQVFRLPAAILEEIPIVRWKLLEQYNRLLRTGGKYT